MKKVFFYGDSLTYGYDPRGAFESRFPESVRWTNVLAERLMGEWEVEVEAMNGREIPESATELIRTEEMLVNHLPFQLMVVMLGTNDYMNMYQPDVVEVTNRMRKFLVHVQRIDEVQMCGTRLMLLAPPHIHTLQDEFYAKYDTTNGVFARAYQALAEHLGIYYADTTAWGLEPAFDGVHLAESANAVFADRMEELLRYTGLQMDMENAVEVY